MEGTAGQARGRVGDNTYLMLGVAGITSGQRSNVTDDMVEGMARQVRAGHGSAWQCKARQCKAGKSIGLGGTG